MTAKAINPVTSAGKRTSQMKRLTTVTVVALLLARRSMATKLSTAGIIRRCLPSARRGGPPGPPRAPPPAPLRGLEQPHDPAQVLEMARDVDDEEARPQL